MLAKWTSTGSTSDTDGGYFVHNEYDCEEKTRRILDFYWYSENMKKGDIVYSEKNINDEGKSISTDSIGTDLFNIACSKK